MDVFRSVPYERNSDFIIHPYKIGGNTMIRIFIALVACVVLCANGHAAQSTIVTAEGSSCMGRDKSRDQAEREAKVNAQRNAVENAQTFIRSQTEVKTFVVEKDVIEAYSQAKVTVLEELKDGTGWYKDPVSGECFKTTIKAEVIPDEKAMQDIAQKPGIADDPSGPLNVKVWTEKKEYRDGEKVRIFLRGNRPFYVRVIYRDVEGKDSLQILPNPHRGDNYFRGGVTYEIPEEGQDKFDLEVTPPFGIEQVILYASTAQLGDIDLQEAGGVYKAKTNSKDIGVKTRGLKLVGKSKSEPTAGAGFVESRVEVRTKK